MSRETETKRRILIRDIAIVCAAVAISFLAKMEAINFLLALTAGIMVGIHVFKAQSKIFENADDANEQLPSGFVRFIFSAVFWHGKLERQLILPVLSGLLSGLLICAVLNYLFVLP